MHGQGYALALTPGEAVLSLRKPRRQEATTDDPSQAAELRMKLIEANPQARPKGVAPLPGKMNYFIGDDPRRWLRDVPTYERVEYAGVYPGIDLVYYGNQQQLEYDFRLVPGADPRQIKLRFDGARKLRLDAGGDLLIETAAGEVRQHRPVIYQELEGQRKEVAGNYKFGGGHEVGFEIGDYDKTKPLVIDPALSYGTFITERTGGFELTDIAVDSAGNAYLVGYSAPSKFSTTPGPFQPVYDGKVNSPNVPNFALVLKLNSTGTQVLYSAMIGGTQSVRGRVSCQDRHDEKDGTGCYRYVFANFAHNIVVDANDNAYITGYTQSMDFPTTPGAYLAARNPLLPSGQAGANTFVAKLNPLGNQLLYSTLYEAGVNDLAVTAQGQVWLAGTVGEYTSITTTPDAFQRTVRGPYFGDVFVTKLNETGSTVLSATYLGSGSGDVAHGIAVDPAGNAYVTGITGNGYGYGDAVLEHFPTTPNAFRATMPGEGMFVTKFAANGRLMYSTFLGASSDSFYGPHIAVDAVGNAYIAGTTRDANFPVTPGAYQPTGGGTAPNGDPNEDVFVSKLNPSGSALVYSTFLGGSPATAPDRGLGICVDSRGNAIVAGYTYSQSFPVFPNNQSPSGNGGFVTKFNATGSGLIYSFVFPNGWNVAVAADAQDNAYVTGFAGNTFATTPGAYQSIITSATGWIAAKIDENATPPTPTRFTITGRTATGNTDSSPAVPNITIRLTGTSIRTATTGQDGRCLFENLPANGNFTVTPMPLTGYFSNPASATFNNLSSNQVANFIIRPTVPPTPSPTPTPPLNTAHVSAATYDGNRLGQESIVTAFGSNLAMATQLGTTNPLPSNLAGTTVKVKDGQGVERMAPLFFVSPTQINYQIPPGSAIGNAFITITNGNGITSGAVKQVDFIVPGLFTADSSGRGLAAAVVLRIRGDGTQSYETVARYDTTQNKMVGVPIDLGPASDQVYLIVFGTGFRFHSGLEGVEARIAGINSPVTFAGAQGNLVAMDQANIRLPRGLAGKGEVDLIFSPDGRPANTVKIWIK